MFKVLCCDCEGSEKCKVLRVLIDKEGDDLKNVIIFCNCKLDVDIVVKLLKKYGYDVVVIYGDFDQVQWMEILDKFWNGELWFFCVLDVVVCGLDILEVSYVFNFDVLSYVEDYVYCIGWMGCVGCKGIVIMICLL